MEVKKLKYGFWQYIIIIFCAIFVGFANGFWGGGGGMLCVPILTFLYKVEDKKAHATAIFVILPISIISALIYAINGDFSLEPTLITTIGAVVGGIIGSLLLRKMPDKIIRVIFGVIMIGV
ncbi:MAG: sulfite exporter TauE/SafE family protein, partial [Bacilli bacterium]